MSPRLAVAAVVMCLTACAGSPASSSVSPSAGVSTTPSALSTATSTSSPSPTPSSKPNPLQACAGINADRRLALVWMSGGNQTTLVHDITDALHPFNVCGLELAAANYPSPGPIRFVTPTAVSVAGQDLLYWLDLTTGTFDPLASPTGARIQDYDFAPDGFSFAYVVITYQDRVAEFHLNMRRDRMDPGSDRLLATVESPSALAASAMHVEFAPSGKSVAFGATGVTGTGEAAPVQVWSVDGRLLFSSSGTNSVTWAGVGDQLFFDNGTDLHRWNGTGTSSLVLAGRWITPSASTDRRYVAYYSPASSEVAVVNSSDGAVTRLPGTNRSPAFLTSTLLHHQVGAGEMRVYDIANATDVASPIIRVFSTWPRATPSYG